MAILSLVLNGARSCGLGRRRCATLLGQSWTRDEYLAMPGIGAHTWRHESGAEESLPPSLARKDAELMVIESMQETGILKASCSISP